MIREHDIKLVDDSLKTLSEHFDSVRIFVTRHENDDTGTMNLCKGSGNWFTAYGHIKKWIAIEEEAFRIESRNNE